MAFSGIFPRDESEVVHRGELAIRLCRECSLVQLDESFPGELLYGDSYGYRSGLNQSMVEHLRTHVTKILASAILEQGDIVCDIGSNDGTLLGLYPELGLKKIGIDPSSGKFKHFYEDDTVVVSDFFSAQAFASHMPGKAKVITSIAMLYDLENPVQFARDVFEILEDDGLWLFEQSYMPWMVETGAYDTICHEHLEYYSMRSVRELLSRAGFVVSEAYFTIANGGSFTVIARKGSHYDDQTTQLDVDESGKDLSSSSFFQAFADGVREHGRVFGDLVRSWVAEGKSVVALGASTKGSIVLQNARLNAAQISSVGEVNEYKFGRLMSGTDIPIKSESEVMAASPDYAIVLPWHFKETFEKSMDKFKKQGTKLVYPLPEIEIT
jgi:hypothetical protein